MPGETSNNQSNFNKYKVSLYAHLYEKHVEIKNVDGTVDVAPEKYTWYNGGVILECVDRRPQPTCSGKRIFLRQNMASLWDDILRLNQAAGGTWTQEMAIQMESQLLLAMHPTVDLDPNSTLQGMKRYDPADGPVKPVHRELKTRKRKLNSYELEQEAAKKAKKEQMMFMMDERHGKEFKPTFKLLPYFKSNMQGRSSSASTKKPGRKLVRRLKFERNSTEAGDKEYKVFTLLSIYQEANGKHEAICHSLYEKELRAEGKYENFMQVIDDDYKLDDSLATFRNELGNAEAYKAFIKSFVVLYSFDNKLKYDSERLDKVPVEMLTEATTELTSPQTEMKFENMQPYKIIELLAQQPDTEKTTSSSSEGAKGLSVADLYNAAAKKAMQVRPSVSAPASQDSSLMPPPPRPPSRRNSNKGNPRARQTTTTQAQVPAHNTPQFLIRAGNQPVQQQIPQAQMQQSPNQRAIQSPILIQQNVPVPQSATDGIRPFTQQISIPRQLPIQIQNIPNAQGVPVPHVLLQRQPNVQTVQGNVRPMQIIQNIPHGTQVNARSVVSQNVAQGDAITSPSMLSARQKIIPVRRTTQEHPQMNVPAQGVQINITRTNPSQVQTTPQINIPAQPTDPTRVTPQLNVQSQMNQVQPQINIPAQVSEQVGIQQTQTTPRLNPGPVTPRMSAQNQMNQAQSPQINIPAQVSDQMQNTTRINSSQIPQVNVTDQINAQMNQLNQPRMNQLFLMPNQSIRYNVVPGSGFIRHPTPGVVNMQGSIQPQFIQSGQNIMMQSSFPIQSQLLPGQPSGIRYPGMRTQIIRPGIPGMLMRQPIIPPQMVNQQLGGVQNQWMFQQNPNQLSQQTQNPPNWNGNGNTNSKQ